MYKKILIALMNQGVVGLISYVLNIVLVTKMSANDYGVYTYIISISTLISGLFVSGTMTQLSEVKKYYRQRFDKKINLMAAHSYHIVALIFLLLLIVASYIFTNIAMLPMILLVTYALVCREIIFIFLFWERNKYGIALLGLTSFIVPSYIIWKSEHIKLNYSLVIFAINNIGFILTLLYFILIVKIDYSSVIKLNIISIKNGGYTILSNLISFSRGNVYNYLVPIFFTFSELAELNIAKLFLTPLLMLIPPINNLYVSSFNSVSQIHKIYSIEYIYTIIFFFYAIALLIFKNEVYQIINVNNFDNFNYFVILWLLYGYVYLIRSSFETKFFIDNNKKLIFIVNLYGFLQITIGLLIIGNFIQLKYMLVFMIITEIMMSVFILNYNRIYGYIKK